LLGGGYNSTDDHYTLQWSHKTGFLQYLQQHPEIKSFMTSGQMGWPALLQEIRDRAQQRLGEISVFDAACGYGGIARDLIQESTKDNLFYVGADIHHSLPDILSQLPLLRECGILLRWDIGNVLPVQHQFDYVICRAAIHHTPDPKKTFDSLCERLKPGGRIAITAYRKKSLAREALDDCFRQCIVPLPSPEGFALARQFTLLGKYLQELTEKVTIEEDLELFGIKRGSYPVQELFYNHFLKCFYNPLFGEEYSTLVNFDWYHPTYAYRYYLDELLSWFSANDLRVVNTQEIPAQYFVLGEK
jgi:SAM-dependent methyltransferase